MNPILHSKSEYWYDRYDLRAGGVLHCHWQIFYEPYQLGLFPFNYWRVNKSHISVIKREVMEHLYCCIAFHNCFKMRLATGPWLGMIGAHGNTIHRRLNHLVSLSLVAKCAFAMMLTAVCTDGRSSRRHDLHPHTKLNHNHNVLIARPTTSPFVSSAFPVAT